MGKLRTLARLTREHGFRGTIREIVRHFFPHAGSWLRLMRQELEAGSDLTITTRIELLRQGYSSLYYHLYDFAGSADRRDYVSRFTQMTRTGGLNGPAAEALNDKESFYRLLGDRGHGSLVPKLHGVLEGGALRSDGTTVGLERLLERDGRLVIKERFGSGGSGVYLCEALPKGVRVNGDVTSLSEFRSRLQTFDGHLVTEFCRQGDYAREIYPRTANTIRILTINPEHGPPFLPMAVHRIGTDTSFPVDNFSQGGLSCEIRLESGELGPGALFRRKEKEWFATHPDTGARIEGVVVPGWQQVHDRMLQICRDVPEWRYVGWDLIVTGAGKFRLLEGNNQTSTRIFQVHRPLLADSRVRSFFERRGVV